MIQTHFSSWGQRPYHDARVAELLHAMPGDCFSFNLFYPMHESFHDLLMHVQEFYRQRDMQATIVCHNSRNALIVSDASFVSIVDYEPHSDPWQKVDRSPDINAYGPSQLLRDMQATLMSRIPKAETPKMTWEYQIGKDRHSRSIPIAKPKPIHQEFYPWIDDIPRYFDRYLASESAVLVLLGDAGTAKTSFVRSLIWYGNLTTMFTYDDDLLKSDSMFVDFITGRADLLVVEDAEVFLRSREHAGNSVMAKFLNISEGLASNGRQKKIIFTANITDVAHIDSALLRAGRCFDCMVFRPLTYDEACAAARAADNPIPSRRDTYTLADLFGEARGETPIMRPSRIGFAGD